MIIAIGKCGVACEVCSYYNQGCMGCLKENKFKNSCVIYRCAEEKEMQYCLQCPEYPCGMMRGISKAYCPLHSHFEIDLLLSTDTLFIP